MLVALPQLTSRRQPDAVSRLTLEPLLLKTGLSPLQWLNSRGVGQEQQGTQPELPGHQNILSPLPAGALRTRYIHKSKVLPVQLWWYLDRKILILSSMIFDLSDL